MSILLACLAMALKDALGTIEVVAASHGRGWLAGILDAGGDLAQILVTLAGAGEILLHGWTPYTIALLIAMMTTSCFGTVVWTKIGARWAT